MEFVFWITLFIIFYAFLGYGILIFIIVKLKNVFQSKSDLNNSFFPSVSFVVPCYNEIDVIEQKILNCLSLEYPRQLIKIIFISDGSNDGTPELIKKYPEICLLHENVRAGKSAAENRAMAFVDSDITIFSDANTILPQDAVKKIVRHYIDPKVGAVSGEKRVKSKSKDKAAGAGEGLYWKYESYLKKLDSQLYTIVGAAGELFSFRTELYSDIEKDTILDDFILSMRIASKGYRVIYEPEAFALETASASIKEELKRKIRICAGGWQAMTRLLHVLNPFSNFVLMFQYVSHRVLRWSIVPIMLILAFILNAKLSLNSSFYLALWTLQIGFYLFGLLGWYFQNLNIKVKVFFVPYYFLIMNYSVIAGFFRFIKNNQPAAWERSQRGL